MQKKNIQNLLDRLIACPINFDPQADHDYGATQPQRVAFVPLALFEEMKILLKNTESKKAVDVLLK